MSQSSPEYHRAWQARNKERTQLYAKRWYEKGGKLVRQKYQKGYNRTPEDYRRWNLKFFYGITPQEYENILQRQDGVCAICGRPETMKRRGKVPPLSVDHNHTSGTIRGLLCMKCNRALGMLDEDVGRLRSAILYLEGANVLV